VALLAAPSQSAVPRPKQGLVDEFPGGPYFVVGCGFSHRNNDDPIVFPGEPGRSHNHTYIGNRFANASSSPPSLRGEATTCALPADSSTYWVPTLYLRRQPILPLVGLVYYVRHTSEPVRPLPAGLKIVAGDADARRRQPLGVASWSCGGVGRAPRSSTVPACGSDRVLQLRVQFPNCWNGKSLDSADHKRHMAYASRGRCPASHSVSVPTIGIILLYPAVEARAQLSSGRFGAHADFINGWDQEALAGLVAGLN
jgi:Domain of unknown function (DUF1996)